MTASHNDDAPNLDDVIDPEEDALPSPIHQGHAGEPERLDDDVLAGAAEQERVAAGLEDYASDQVPPATGPLPEQSTEAADRAQRGLTDEDENPV